LRGAGAAARHPDSNTLAGDGDPIARHGNSGNEYAHTGDGYAVHPRSFADGGNAGNEHAHTGNRHAVNPRSFADGGNAVALSDVPAARQAYADSDGCRPHRDSYRFAGAGNVDSCSWRDANANYHADADSRRRDCASRGHTAAGRRDRAGRAGSRRG
jgi:hypothetical protein